MQVKKTKKKSASKPAKRKVVAKKSAPKKTSKVTVIAKGVVKREPGYMYFVNGGGDVCSARMKHKSKK